MQLESFNIFKWVGGFFSSEKNTSSKRLVGIAGAFTLFHTLHKNPNNEALVWATAVIAGVALGLTTLEAINGFIRGYKEKK